MKIIKAGTLPKVTLNVTCRFCKAELEIYPSDVRKNKADFPAYPDAYYFKCPSCFRTNYMDYMKLPEEFRMELAEL